MNDKAVEVKRLLEETFDIPFSVSCGYKHNEAWFIVSPENDMEELFDIEVSFRQNIRIIVEIIPQKYAKNMIADMQQADERKKTIFLQYVDALKRKGAKTEIYINQVLADCSESSTWTHEWRQFRARITKSPITEENEIFDEARIAGEWIISATGMMLSLLNIEQMGNESLMIEGGKHEVVANKYERNPVNRELCLAANGYVCKICGFDFEKFYGEIGNKYIHVHHIEMISEHESAYYINPEKDLIPVCPNCHAMLHRKTPPFLPDEIKKQIEEQGRKENDEFG